jgi:sporulation protein YlmC with PRC-barrel domain
VDGRDACGLFRVGFSFSIQERHMNTRNILSTAALAVLLAAPAYAQTGSPSPTGSQPGMMQNQPGSGAGTMSQPAANAVGAQTINQAQNAQGKWRASKLMGVDIYGPNNEKVGDVTEVIIDRSGHIESVTVGVGGFLGIGQKDVAIPFDQIVWSDRPVTTGSLGTAGNANTGVANNNAVNTGTAGTGTAGTGVAMNNPGVNTTGTVINRGAGNSAADASSSDEMYPDHGRIQMTRVQLEAAPAVSYSR